MLKRYLVPGLVRSPRCNVHINHTSIRYLEIIGKCRQQAHSIVIFVMVPVGTLLHLQSTHHYTHVNDSLLQIFGGHSCTLLLFHIVITQAYAHLAHLVQDKILQSMSKGNEVTVTNDGATILKSVYIDNPAAKVLVGEFSCD